ncbi:glucose 1-dehydrogenase [Segetibacter koreensis]|uniref:glucose 1-dehydrogenase n=1 Tax=Segetibacter koreensis TaxID=398037 RepID=UPI00037ADA85|nr:glucose 1-dehydrogenase [Segetibacter koreensis]
MENDLKGKVAIVTGGASGIGKATAILYAEHGARVVVSDIHEQAGNDVVAQIKQKGGDAVFVKADVSQARDCEQLVNKTIEAFGSLDIAFNNAGIAGEENAISDMSIEGWDRIIAVNLSSVFYCMKYELQQMLKQGKGTIVNNSSILGSVGFANSAGYVSAKHAVVGLTKNAAIEYSRKGIRVNSIGPAFINTPLLAEAGIDDAAKKMLVQLHPIGRFGESIEVAELVVWLSSDKASFVTGSYYAIDGGYLSQ